MCTVGKIVRHKQPEVYQELAKIKKVTKPVKPKKVKINEREAEQLMKHDSYKRIGRAVKQVKYTNEK